MLNVLKMALRNLARFRRRTWLTATLITLGMVAVLLFIATAGSFKAMMIGQFTDGVLGHLEVHRKGYVASIDTLPLNLNLQPAMVGKIEQVLGTMSEVEAYSERVKLGAMFSNFTETTSIRINGVDPQKEAATTPLLPGRVVEGSKERPMLKRGEILIPTLLARGMKVKVGGHGRAGRHQSRRLGQRQDVYCQRNHGKHIGPERARWLHPDRRCAGPAATEGAGDQRDRHPSQGSRPARSGAGAGSVRSSVALPTRTEGRSWKCTPGQICRRFPASCG